MENIKVQVTCHATENGQESGITFISCTLSTAQGIAPRLNRALVSNAGFGQVGACFFLGRGLREVEKALVSTACTAVFLGTLRESSADEATLVSQLWGKPRNDNQTHVVSDANYTQIIKYSYFSPVHFR